MVASKEQKDTGDATHGWKRRGREEGGGLRETHEKSDAQMRRM